MQTSIRQEAGSTVIGVSGRLDVVTAEAFEAKGEEHVDAGRSTGSVILDLTELEYVSSAGLRSFLSLAKRLKVEGISLSVCGMTAFVQEIFAISGMDSFFRLHASLEAALATEA